MKYEFHVGDYVEDAVGKIGYINSICQCEKCKERGFYEPYVIYTNGDSDYITAYEYEKGFLDYKRIGQYDFTKKDKIEPLEYNGSPDWDDSLLLDKINELVEAVNRLEEKVNGMAQS